MADETTPDSAAVLYPNDVPKSEQPAPQPPKASAAQDKPSSAEILYPDDKPDGDQADEPVHGAPDSEYSLELPAGLTMTEEIWKEVGPTFRELNLSNAGAQRLMPLAAKFRDRVIDGQTKAHGAAAKEWAAQAKADPDIGGANWRETETMMSSAMKAGNDREFAALLEESKLGNHPAMVRFLRNVGRALARTG